MIIVNQLNLAQIPNPWMCGFAEVFLTAPLTRGAPGQWLVALRRDVLMGYYGRTRGWDDKCSRVMTGEF